MASYVSFWQIKMESGNADIYIPSSREKILHIFVSFVDLNHFPKVASDYFYLFELLFERYS